MSKIIVVGGGPAGMMAAITAAQNGNSVLLLERGKTVGKKLSITGKGRCNVTNDCDNQTLIENVTVNARFLYAAFNKFSTQDTIAFFEGLGVPLKTERGNRVFPVSDNANDIVGALKRAAARAGVSIRYNSKVTGVIVSDGQAVGVSCNNENLYADAVILALGGASYPTTGSDGLGFDIVKDLGHNVTPLKPSLIPIVTKEKWPSQLSGLSLRNVAVKLFDNSIQKVIYEDFGEALFTHFGMSGPVILSLSSHIKNIEKDRFKILIDLKPALTEKQLDARLLREFSDTKITELKTVYRRLLPASFAEIFGEICGICDTTHVSQVTKQMRADIVHALKNVELTVDSFRPIREAIITSGGIDVTEIDPKNMQSKLIAELYFAGEMIDVDAYTGGFNLQIAFSTGFLAGNSIY